MNISTIYFKTLKIILSCKNIQHINVAHKYLGNARRYLEWIHIDMLATKLFEHELKILEDDTRNGAGASLEN